MLITKKPELIEAHFEGDYLVYTLGEYTIKEQMKAKEIRDFSDNGWTKDRSMRQIAHIPALEWAKHPEFEYDDKALKKWLQNEGSAYRTVTKGI